MSNPNITLRPGIAKLSGFITQGYPLNVPDDYGLTGEVLSSLGSSGNTDWIPQPVVTGTPLSTPLTTMSRDASAITAVRGIKLDDPTTGVARLQLNAASSGNWTATFPTGSGSAGQVLRTDGSGILTWVNKATLSATSVSTPSTTMGRDGSGKTSVRGVYIDDSGGTNRVQLLSVSAGASWNMTLPNSAGTAGQILETDGSGITSWSSDGMAVSISTPSTIIGRNASGGTALRGLWLDNGVPANAVHIIPPPGLAVSYNFELPLNAGTSGSLYTSDGIGNSSWDPAVSTSDVNEIAKRNGSGIIALKGLTLDSTGPSDVLISPGGSGSWTFTLPIDDGTTDYPLVTDGSGVTSWSLLTAPGGGTGLTTFTANRILLGNAAGNIAQASAVGSTGQVYYAANTWSYIPTLGAVGSIGTLSLAGNTSGVVTIAPQAIAGAYNFNLPTTAGTAGQVLLSAGGGASPMTWSTTVAVANGGTGVTSLTANTILIGNAGSGITELASVGATGQQLIAGGAAPTWNYSPVIGATGNAGSIILSNSAPNTVTLEPNTVIGSNFSLIFPTTVGSTTSAITSTGTALSSTGDLGIAFGGTATNSFTTNSLIIIDSVGVYNTKASTGGDIMARDTSVLNYKRNPIVGVAGGAAGSFKLIGATSGDITVVAPATISGSGNYTVTLPTTAPGNNNIFVETNSVTSTAAPTEWISSFPGTSLGFKYFNELDDFLTASYETTSITPERLIGNSNWNLAYSAGVTISTGTTGTANFFGELSVSLDATDAHYFTMWKSFPMPSGGLSTNGEWFELKCKLSTPSASYTNSRFLFGIFELVAGAMPTTASPVNAVTVELRAHSVAILASNYVASVNSTSTLTDTVAAGSVYTISIMCNSPSLTTTPNRYQGSLVKNAGTLRTATPTSGNTPANTVTYVYGIQWRNNGASAAKDITIDYISFRGVMRTARL